MKKKNKKKYNICVDIPTGIEVITVCGSMRFRELMQHVEKELMMMGKVVLMPCCMGVDLQQENDSNVKFMADRQHKLKIEMSQGVLVINKDDYIGESTRAKINHALDNKIPVMYLFTPEWAESTGYEAVPFKQ